MPRRSWLCALLLATFVTACQVTPAPTAMPTPTTIPYSPQTATPGVTATQATMAVSPTQVLPTASATMRSIATLTPTNSPTSSAAPPTISPARPLCSAIRISSLPWHTYAIEDGAFDAARGLLYVIGQTGDAAIRDAGSAAGGVLSVVDVESGEVRASVPLPAAVNYAASLLLSADGTRLYLLGNDPAHQLLMVGSGAGGTSLGSVLAAREGVRGMALDAAANQLYVLEGNIAESGVADTSFLAQLDGMTMAVARRVPVNDLPPMPARIAMAVNPVAGRLYLIRPDLKSLLVFRTLDLKREPDLSLGGEVEMLLPDPRLPQTYALVREYTLLETLTHVVVLRDEVGPLWRGDAGYRAGWLAIDAGTGHLLLLEDSSGYGVEPHSRLRMLSPETGEVAQAFALPYLGMTDATAAFVHGCHLYRVGRDMVGIDLTTGSVGPRYPLGIELTSVAWDEAADRLAVLDDMATLYILDAQTMRVLYTWPDVLGIGSGHVYIAPLAMSGGRVLVADIMANRTVVLDAASGARIATIPKSGEIVIDTRRPRLYIVNQGVYLVNDRYEIVGAIAETVRQGEGMGVPGAIDAIYDAAQDRLLVTMSSNVAGSSRRTWLEVYDAATLRRTLPDIKTAQQFVSGVTTGAASGNIWLTGSFPDHELSAYAADGALLARIVGMGEPLFADEARQRLYVVDWGGLLIVDTRDHEVQRYEPLPEGLQIEAFDTRRQQLYARRAQSADLIVIHPDGVPALLPHTVGSLPKGWVRELEIGADGTRYALVMTSEIGVPQLFRSLEGEWQRIGHGLPPHSDLRLLAAPGASHVLFALSRQPSAAVGLFRSTDGGVSWEVAARGLSDLRIRDLALSPDFGRDGRAVLLAGDGGVYESRDGGASWRHVADVNGLKVAVATDVQGRLQVMVAATEQDSWHTRLWVASDGDGNTLGAFAPAGAIGVAAYNVQSIFLAADASRGVVLLSEAERGLLRSDDMGRTWQMIGLRADRQPITAHARSSPTFVRDNTIYLLLTSPYPAAGSWSALLRSTDTGLTWERAADDFADATTVLAVAPDGTLWIGNLRGEIIEISPEALTWRPVLATIQEAPPTPTPYPIATPTLSPTARAPALATAPPVGVHRPEGLFADLWAKDAALAQALGWATSREPQMANVAFQPFERGMMIWREDTRQIYALYHDGSWDIFPDIWAEPQPQSDPSLTPPEGRVQPVRGFGLVWQQQPGVRERLGWGLHAEEGLAAPLQAFERGLLVRISDITYALLAPDGLPTTWHQRS